MILFFFPQKIDNIDWDRINLIEAIVRYRLRPYAVARKIMAVQELPQGALARYQKV